MAGTFFKQWRKYRGFTLEQVAGRLSDMDDPLIPSSVGSLSRLEAGLQPYNQRIVEALASEGIYNCDPDDLIGVDPFARDELDELLAGFKGKSEIERARIARFLKALEATEMPDSAPVERKEDVR